MDSSTSPPERRLPTFGALDHAEVGFVFNLVRRFGAREADLEDLTHDVFMAAWNSRASFDASRPVRPWLMGIAFRVVSDSLNRAQHRVEVARSLELPEGPSWSRLRTARQEFNAAVQSVEQRGGRCVTT